MKEQAEKEVCSREETDCNGGAKTEDASPPLATPRIPRRWSARNA